MPTLGYVYVNAIEHNAEYQRDLLRRSGSDRLFEDIATSPTARRPQLARALDALQAGDRLVVWRLDRLGTSSASVLALLAVLMDRRVGLTSIDEAFDTDGPDGHAIRRTLSAFTSLERHIVRERTLERVYAAKSRGRIGGRPRVLSDANRARAAALRDQGASIREIAEELGTSRATVYRALGGAEAPDDHDDEVEISLRLGASGRTEQDPLSAPG